MPPSHFFNASKTWCTARPFHASESPLRKQDFPPDISQTENCRFLEVSERRLGRVSITLLERNAGGRDGSGTKKEPFAGSRYLWRPAVSRMHHEKLRAGNQWFFWLDYILFYECPEMPDGLSCRSFVEKSACHPPHFVVRCSVHVLLKSQSFHL